MAEGAVFNMTERDILLKKLSSYQFMIDDLKLYLDTHPRDEQTIAKVVDYKNQLVPIREKYEKLYGPLMADATGSNKWKWIKSPWPWETQEDD